MDRHRQKERERESNVAATCVSNSRTPVARGFFPAKVARIVSFCLEQSIGRRVLNTSIPTASTVTLYPHLLQYTRLPILVDPIFPARASGSLALFLFLPFSVFLSYLRYVLSGLASPLHLFSSPFGAPFASSCHRFLLPPASYKDAQETCLFLHPAMGCRDRLRRRLQALAFQHIAAPVCMRTARSPKSRVLRLSRPPFSPRSSFAFSSLSRTISTMSGMPIQAHLSGKVFTVNAPTRIFRVGKNRCYMGGITSSIIRP